jgi:tripartite-type tricarboxylate transporter receptor subunit TctC
MSARVSRTTIYGGCRAASLAGLFGLGLVSAFAATADFYKGKNLNVVIGYAPGGGYDVFGRLLGSHMVDYLPGKPIAVPQNMPGASSVRSADYLYSIAPRDGTVIGLFASSAVFAPLLGNKAARYDAAKFTWIGNLGQATGTCAVWHTSGISSFEDLRRKPVIFGASAPGGFDSEYPRALNAIFGTKIRVVHGYNGAASVVLAMERGEVQGGCAFPVDALLSLRRADFEAKRLVPVIQFALKNDVLKGVPHVLDFTHNENERQLFNLLFNRDRLGRPVAAPPGLAVEQVKVLREAFDATVKDPAFRGEAEKRDLLLNPENGADVEAFVDEMESYPAAVVTRAREALAIGDVENVKPQ